MYHRRVHLLRAIIFTAIIIAFPFPSARAEFSLDPQRGVLTLAPVIDPIKPSVVYIIALTGPNSGVSGSGVIVDSKEGYILTNHHVIADAVKVRVRLVDGRIFEAKKIGSDAATDIGLIKISTTDLVALPIDLSNELSVGDYVMALGYPLGLEQTVTHGMVSGLGRAVGQDEFEDFIQTDAAINHGNSGGALVDSRGRLVGINTLILSPTNANIGLGFAVPIKIALSIFEQLKTYGEVRRGRLGVDFRDLTPELADAIGIRPTGGVLVTRVPLGSIGQVVGIKTGDVAVKVNDTPMRHAKDFKNIIGLSPIDTDLKILVIRDGQEVTINVRLTKPELGAAPVRFLGATFGALPEDVSGARNVQGVLVTVVEPGSLAAKNDLRRGDIVVRVNRNETPSPDALKTEFASVDNIMAMTIVRGRSRLIIVFP
jgi:serine protease DegQ